VSVGNTHTKEVWFVSTNDVSMLCRLSIDQ